MKKLMFAAAAVAVVGGAYADPLVYQYKASIKQVNLKVKKVKFEGDTYEAYIKYQSSASLKGYLIQDADGATSDNIQKLVAAKYPTKYTNTVPALRTTNLGVDYGRNTAFLVVQNSKAEKDVRYPKILPAVLDTKWIDDSIATKNSGLAEGYLYVGGDVIAAPQREALDIFDGTLYLRSAGGSAATPAKGFIGDYCWTSIWLFGMYNGPFFETTALGLDNAQAAIDGAHDVSLQQPYVAGTSYFFHDTWMNGSGLGKWTSGKVNKPCCGVSSGALGPRYSSSKSPKTLAVKVLDSLSGNLKGGIFLCTENGVVEGTAGQTIPSPGLGLVWEDQFFTQRWDKNGLNPGTWVGAGDVDQIDLWQDGDLELNTSDVITGTWSIKYTDKLKPVAVTATELTDLGAAGTTEDAQGLRTLVNTIKGAAVDLNKDVVFADGNEIWNVAEPTHTAKVPFVTPQFFAYYGLLNFK